MSFAIKAFEPELAWIGDRSRLTRNLPALSEVDGESSKLGTFLVCMSVILRHPGVKIVVPEEVFDLLREFCSFATLLTQAESEDVLFISPLDISSGKFFEGEVIMPVYVSRDSKIVYNVYPAESPIVNFTPELLEGALNCFNMRVRDNTVGTSRIVWRDPVIGETKYQDKGFDFMFALWVADGYLRVIDIEYPYIDKFINLALCEKAVKLFTARASERITLWELSPEMQTEFQVPWLRPSGFGTISNDVASSGAAPAFDVDPIKRELFAVLFFIARNGLKHDSPFTLLVVGTKLFDHLSTVHAMFSHCEIVVISPGKLKLPIELRQIEAKATPAEVAKAVKGVKGGRAVLLVSGLAVNSMIYKSFQGMSMLVPYTSVSYKPLVSFLACFAPSAEIPGYFLLGAEKVAADPKALEAHKGSFSLAYKRLNAMFRNTHKWTYHLPNQTEEMSYDEACLQTILGYITGA